ncbi:MAG: hypothetical protein U1E60_25500 [Reyranellaceae bacterium]
MRMSRAAPAAESCRDRAPDIEERDNRQRAATGGLTSASRPLALAGSAGLFQTPDGIAYADLEIDGHRETWAVRGRFFRRWLIRQGLSMSDGMPSMQALNETLGVLETRALSAGPVREVKVRIGRLDDRIYLDLGDPAWRAVEIDADGWRLVERPALRFRRPAIQQPLPAPERGGTITMLRRQLNLATETDLAMAIAWLIAALGARGPYPVLVLTGEAGAGKSTFMAMMQALVDPGAARLRALPRGERELIVAARDSHVLAFDNLSSLPGWFSDALCRMVSGGGFAATHEGGAAEPGMAGMARPVILNGITDIVARPDLADRALFVTMNGIPPERRRTEADLWAAFEAARPCLLGVLLDAVSAGLSRLPKIRLTQAPRMADLARWVEACEPSLFAPGVFKTLYSGNRDGAARDAIECDAFIASVLDLACQEGTWVGSATQLHREMPPVVGGPGNARALSSRLRQGAAFLRRCGIEVHFGRTGSSGKRFIHLRVVPHSLAAAIMAAAAKPDQEDAVASGPSA